MTHPLSGVRVLDCSRLLPGPFASLMLADLGADVIKVEDTGGGDYTRWMPPLAGNLSGAFLLLNRNKRSIQLNLKSDGGREAFKKLVASADVVLESFRPGVMDKLGVGYSTLKTINPRLVYCSITGYGQNGPYRDRAGHDINYNALAGVLDVSGDHDGPPMMAGVQIADIGGGSLNGVIGILAALYRREKTGEGDSVDISMTDGALNMGIMNFARMVAENKPARRGLDPLNGGFGCYQIYETKDGRHMGCGALEPKFWEAFCKANQREDLIGAAMDPPTRADSREKIADLFASKTQAEWVRFLDENHVDACIEPVHTVEEAKNDPQLNHRGMFFEIDHPDPAREPILQVRTPVHIGSQPEIPKSPAPQIGQHTASVLAEAGYGESEIEALAACGAIKVGP